MSLATNSRVGGCFRRVASRVWDRLRARPAAAGVSEIAGISSDVCRTRRELVVKECYAADQVNVLRRSVKRPKLGSIDRLKLLLGASLLPAWRKTVTIVQAEPILRCHRAGLRLFRLAKGGRATARP